MHAGLSDEDMKSLPRNLPKERRLRGGVNPIAMLSGIGQRECIHRHLQGETFTRRIPTNSPRQKRAKLFEIVVSAFVVLP